MNKGKMKFSFMDVYALVMMVYTGWRTYDYMSGNLQGVTPTVALIVACAFLFFSEVGLLVWLHYGAPNATTEVQETTADILTWVNFIGLMVIGLADLIKHNTMYQIDLSIIDPLLFFAPWVMVAANIAGYLIYARYDAEQEIQRSARQLKHEEHQLEITARRAAIEQLNQSKEIMARKLAPGIARDVTDRVTNNYEKLYGKTGNTGSNQSLPPHNQGVDRAVYAKDVDPANGAGENPTQR